MRSINNVTSPFTFTDGELIEREKLYRDVKKIYANQYDAKPILVGKNKKIKLDLMFLSAVSDEEFLVALTFVTTPEKILTIEDAKKAGLKIIVTNGINPETNRKTVEIARKYDIVKAALGIYPIRQLQKEIKEGIKEIS